MRYRKLDPDGDYSFGHSQADFYRDQPEAVAQAVQTRLGLFTGDWFLDQSQGTAWRTNVLGKNTKSVYDMVLKERIAQTTGVVSIDSYTSSLDPTTRRLSVQVTITTQYRTSSVNVTL